MKTVSIYTDGACSGNPGPGGYAGILLYGKHEKSVTGFKEATTNNEMELTAAVKALELLKEPCRVKLHSDSAYLVNAFNEKWIDNWEALGWKKKKDELKNRELWETLHRLTKIHEVTWIKVKGHSDNEYNNKCDRLATGEIEKNTSNPLAEE
ncbi:MAG: ribonuclease HI [Clostridia bacterium]